MRKPERQRDRETHREQTKSGYSKFLALHKSDDKGQLWCNLLKKGKRFKVFIARLQLITFWKLYETLSLVTLVDFKRSLFDEVLHVLKKHFIKQPCKIFWILSNIYEEVFYWKKAILAKIYIIDNWQGPEHTSCLWRRDQSTTIDTANTVVQLTVEHSHRSKQNVTSMLSWCYIK